MDKINEILAKSLGSFTLGRLLATVVTFLLCLLVTKLVMRLVGRAIERLNVEKTLHTFLKTTIRMLLLFISIVICLDMLNIPVTSFIALFSVAGLAVSLSIQGVLGNVAGGIQLLMNKPFRAGDYVEANGVSGSVVEVGLVHTKLTTVDNKVIFIPNSAITATQITNFSAMPTRRIDFAVSASYNADVETVCAALREAAVQNGSVLSDPAPFAAVTGYGESSIGYLLRIWCAGKDYWDVYYDVLAAIKKAFDAHGVEMTYNHLNVHVLDK